MFADAGTLLPNNGEGTLAVKNPELSLEPRATEVPLDRVLRTLILNCLMTAPGRYFSCRWVSIGVSVLDRERLPYQTHT